MPRPGERVDEQLQPCRERERLVRLLVAERDERGRSARPAITSPQVIAPIETSATSGRPSELGIAIASGFVPVSGSPPSGCRSRARRRRRQHRDEAALGEPVSPSSRARRSGRCRAQTTSRARSGGRSASAAHDRARARGSRARRRRPSARTLLVDEERSGRARVDLGSVPSHSIREWPWPGFPCRSAAVEVRVQRLDVLLGQPERPQPRRSASSRVTARVYGRRAGRRPYATNSDGWPPLPGGSSEGRLRAPLP